jgi:predicted amidohydrolase
MLDRPLRVAATQMNAAIGDVAGNLAKAGALVREAFDRGAEWVILPEFFTSAMAFHSKMLDAARRVDGEPLQLLVNLAKQHGGVVGGSFIAVRGDNVYNIFALAFPDGSVFFHDKDQPTMWENCYYIGGRDDGVLETPAGPVGAALCWEMIRSRTARRLLDKVNLVVGGSCWWDLPDDAPPHRDALRARNLALLAETPARLARILGVPVIHASHCGDFEGRALHDFALREDRAYKSHYLGEAQIVDGTGTVLARRSQEQGEGVIVAEITPGPVEVARDPIPDSFWIPELWEPLLKAWEKENALGQYYYQNLRPARAILSGVQRETATER